jgi:hypothetical protein
MISRVAPWTRLVWTAARIAVVAAIGCGGRASNTSTGPTGGAGGSAACSPDVCSDISDPSKWATFNVDTVNAGSVGFFGSVFDGRYLYLVPFWYGSFAHGIITRYDTEAAFSSGASWVTFDISTVNPGAVGFVGGAFDGRHVYLVPSNNGVSGIAARYDTQAGLSGAGSWETFDVSSVNSEATGFTGAAFDGRYVYLVPTMNRIVARYDTQAAFSNGGSWAAFDVSTVNPGARGFQGAAFDGRYLYLVPYANVDLDGIVARYDTTAAFASSSSWATFDVSTVNPGAKGFAGAAFDGRYLYLVPSNNVPSVADGIVARYDTTAAFASSSSWATFDVSTVNPSAKGFLGAAFDGRYLYLVPYWDGSFVHGIITRYDTQAAFSSGASWVTFDISTVNAGAVGFAGAAFDGRYVYLARFDAPLGSHGTVARFDAKNPPSMPKLPGWFTWGPGSFF